MGGLLDIKLLFDEHLKMISVKRNKTLGLELQNLIPTILGKNIWNKIEKKSLISTLAVFWLLLPKFITGREIGHVSTQIWDFPDISLFIKTLSLRQLVYQVCYTRNHVPFYLWLIGSVLKHCKVQKYYDQDCLKILFLLSTLLVKIQISWKNAHLFLKS